MLDAILLIVFVLVVIGLIIFLINRAPFIDAEIKMFIKWALIVVAAIYMIYVVANLLGVSGHFPSLR